MDPAPLFDIFRGYPQLAAALSDKRAGSLRLGSSDPLIPARRETFLASLAVPKERHVAAGLIHSIHATPVNWAEGGSVVAETDGLLTREPNLYLSVTVADCLPIYLFDPATGMTGILHAGWHGLTLGMVPSAMKQVEAMGGNADDLLVGIGPAIGLCHFEIHRSIRDRFLDHPDAIEERNGKLFVDLKAIARAQFLSAGVALERIETSAECTHCLEDKYFSNRRDKPQEIEAMMAVIGLRDKL